MGKKNLATATDKNGVPMPDPAPKVGDQVEYNWPDGSDKPRRSGKVFKANITAVLEGFDGRLVDLDVDAGGGVEKVASAPWRDEGDGAGNTWHWPS